MKALDQTSRAQGSKARISPSNNQTRAPRSKSIKDPQEFARRVLGAAIAKIEKIIPDEAQIREEAQILPWNNNMDHDYELRRELQQAKLDAKLQFRQGMKFAAFSLTNEPLKIIQAAMKKLAA